MTPFNNNWIDFEEKMARYWLDRSCGFEEQPLTYGHGQPHVVYGTFPTKDCDNRITQTERGIVRFTLIAITSMLLLWIT